MRNRHGLWVPNIGDYVYYKNKFGNILPGKVIDIQNPNSNYPIVLVLGHVLADQGKKFEKELSELKSYPEDWSNEQNRETEAKS